MPHAPMPGMYGYETAMREGSSGCMPCGAMPDRSKLCLPSSSFALLLLLSSSVHRCLVASAHDRPLHTSRIVFGVTPYLGATALQCSMLPRLSVPPLPGFGLRS
eukprot:CAMPEP_0179458568 /NCGR_PEP_ID=MMETSP0799-20121207/42102_1 /TAXON_ID=46947 /ORGANISM="Geminigera cryophila, Strain CCMP2564" /LENGTH=103 /DNA_ID=CAMNT_0021259917 /DNA_START=702 /DNA_END=1013 /DNA_ORIENTATION=+